MAERWRGIFTILLTPFQEDRALDEESLRREVDFVIAAGAHGIVTPVNTSEFFLLSDDERRRITEIAVGQARGRVPVVIGTAAPATAASGWSGLLWTLSALSSSPRDSSACRIAIT